MVSIQSYIPVTKHVSSSTWGDFVIFADSITWTSGLISIQTVGDDDGDDKMSCSLKINL